MSSRAWAPALESPNNYGPIYTFKCSVQTIFNWVFSSDKRFYSLDFGPESLPRTSIKKGRENLGVWVLVCYGQPSWFFTCKHSTVWAKMKWPFVVGEMIANAQQRKKTFETNIFKFFLERASISNFCCATNQNNPRKYVSYDRSHLLQPCGKFLSWASPIPLGNFYPLAPPPPRNFH